MEESKFIISVIFLILWLVNCASRRIKHETIQSFNKKTGESVAVDNLIQKYEKEHQKFYQKETRDGPWLGWPALNTKYLSIYCRNYVQHSVPSIPINNTIGTVKLVELHYWKENTSTISKVVTVQCKVKKEYSLNYYITRAPEPNCVYSLQCTKNSPQKIFTIIHKHCDFESVSLIKRDLKRKKEEMTFMIHHRTGQFVAKHEYLLEYEIQHHKMFKEEVQEGKKIEWPYVMDHPNLDYYCYQYMGECVYTRHRKGVTGIWKYNKMLYHYFNTLKYIEVTTVTCILQNADKVHYHITRAPETNCAYALLRKIYKGHYFYVISFKHCDFEDPIDQHTFSQNQNIPNMNVIPKIEMKNEMEDTLGILQLFPGD